MRLTRIDDGRDPRLADYVGVREPTWLRDRGLLIAEGRFVVRRALTLDRIRCRSLLLHEAAAEALRDALEQVDASVDVFVASPEVITAATGFNLHRGCLAVAERPAAVTLPSLLASANVVCVLERVVDADNVGSAFRCAEAFGADAVLLSPGCCDPFYRKAIRTSSGAALVVPHAEGGPWPDTLDAMRAAGFVIAATTPDPTATAIGSFVHAAEAQGKVAVLFGTEGQGLTDEALARSDVRLRVPMTGALDSLNVGTTVGIVLHRLHEVRRSA